MAGSPYGAAGTPPGFGDGDTAAMQAIAQEPPLYGPAAGAEPPSGPMGSGRTGPDPMSPGPTDPMPAGPTPMGPMDAPMGPGEELGGPRRHARRRPSGRRTGLKVAAVAAGAVVAVGGATAGAFALTGGEDSATVAPDPKDAVAAPPPIDPKVLEERRRQLAHERASRASREEASKRLPLLPKGTPIPTKKPTPKRSSSGGVPNEGSPVPAGVAQAYAKSVMDDPGTQFGCLQKLWDKESNWNYKAANPSSGAYGIPQALPGSKMASAGDDWRTNYKTQIRWGLGYIDDRYGTPCKAWQHSQSVGWY